MAPIATAALAIVAIFTLQCSAHPVAEPNGASSGSNSVYQSQSPIGLCGINGFSDAVDEHIVNEIMEPFVVTGIRGTIRSEAGDWPEGIRVLFEVRSSRAGAKIQRAMTDAHGKFMMKGIPDGQYCFKATVNGWQSVMGVIIVSKKADPKNKIVFEMRLGV